MIDKYNVCVAGPNVSDFEPLGNVLYLCVLRRSSRVPAKHTTNLFVERVKEPEANDHRVLGSAARDWLSLNLVKKARIIDGIGRDLGCEETYCTYNSWTIRRLSRWSDNPEQKQADYLMRYIVLAAGSGAFSRLYWGALVCSRDGIIDCGDKGYPAIDNVSYYREIRGELDQLRIRPAFRALQQAIAILPGSTCVTAVHSQHGIHHFVFENKQGGEFHINWCRDSYQLPLRLLYSSALDECTEARYFNVLGEELDAAPETIGEQPPDNSF